MGAEIRGGGVAMVEGGVVGSCKLGGEVVLVDVMVEGGWVRIGAMISAYPKNIF